MIDIENQIDYRHLCNNHSNYEQLIEDMKTHLLWMGEHVRDHVLWVVGKHFPELKEKLEELKVDEDLIFVFRGEIL